MKNMRLTLLLLFVLLIMPRAGAQVTVEECVEKATTNYPAIARYGLLQHSESIELRDINSSWYPRIGIYGQATGQNSVPSFPVVLSDMLSKLGQSMDGLGKFQYKGGVEVNQTIWDGGAAPRRRDLVRAGNAAQTAAVDVEMYAIRERVENLFFAVLLIEDQIEINRLTADILSSNLAKLQSMFRNGTAMQADCDMLEARLLTVSQGIATAEYAVKGYREMLGLFTGEDMSSATLLRPAVPALPSGEPSRPELSLFESRMAVNDASERLSDAAIMPRVGAFVQAYYGYPGMDYFKSMMNRDPSFNLLAGVKISWNIDSFYTRKDRSRKRDIENQQILADLDIFLFNTDLQSASERQTIEGLRKVMADDGRIVELQTNVRRVAESQLTNGVIDVTALLTKIADESQASLTAKYHEIQLIQEIYKLKYTLNK